MGGFRIPAVGIYWLIQHAYRLRDGALFGRSIALCNIANIRIEQ